MTPEKQLKQITNSNYLINYESFNFEKKVLLFDIKSYHLESM